MPEDTLYTITEFIDYMYEKNQEYPHTEAQWSEADIEQIQLWTQLEILHELKRVSSLLDKINSNLMR